MDLALNNLQWLMCHKTKLNQPQKRSKINQCSSNPVRECISLSTNTFVKGMIESSLSQL